MAYDGGGTALAPMNMPQPTTHDVTIVTTKKLAQARVLGVPAEEFGVSRNTRSLKDTDYCFHDVVTKTEAQYIAEGFDEDDIKGLETYVGNTDIETLARDTEQEHQFTGGDGLNTAARLVRTTEHYIRMDYEGNGKPCLYLVITGGAQGQVLHKDGKICVYPVDVIPFATWTPVPVPHRFFGRSVADLVMPLQREKTALKRGALDNLYLHNNPRVEVSEAQAGPNTLDDLMVSRIGGFVRTKQPGGINWQVVPDITPSVYPMLQYLDAELEQRTGLSKQTQGLDANALQNQSATAVAQVFNASQMRMKLIARQLADGVKDIFALLHHTIRTHGEEQQTVRLRNQWVTVDPRQWKTRDDMTINVGLGTGGKAQQFAQLMALANFQKELLMGGKANMVDDSGLFNTASEMAKLMGFKNPDRFFNDPQATDPQTGQLLHPPPPPPPSPEVIKGQVQLQIEQSKGQLEAQKTQLKAQQDAQKAQLDAFHQKVKLEGELQLAREKADLEAKLALIDAGIKQREDERKHEEHRLKMAHAEQAHQHAMANPPAPTPKMARTQTKAHAKVQAAQEHSKSSERIAAKMDENTQALLAAVKEMSRPKRIVRDPKTGKPSHVEPI